MRILLVVQVDPKDGYTEDVDDELGGPILGSHDNGSAEAYTPTLVAQRLQDVLQDVTKHDDTTGWMVRSAKLA